MIDRGHELAVIRQAKLLKLSRSSVYYRPRPASPADLAIMRRIDELHLDYPFAGSRMLRDLLRGEGIAIGRQRVATMMKRMGIAALSRTACLPPSRSSRAPHTRSVPVISMTSGSPPASGEKVARVASISKIKFQCFQRLEEGWHNEHLIAIGRMLRSTVLKSISMRPSSRKRTSPSQ